jgi:hypothetical protein
MGDLTLALVDICGMSNLYIFSPGEIIHFFKPSQPVKVATK